MRTISDDVLELRLLVVDARDRGAYEEVRSIMFELMDASAGSILTAEAEEGEDLPDFDSGDEGVEVEGAAGALAAIASASLASIAISLATRELAAG